VPGPQWYPGDLAPGTKVNSGTQLDTQTAIFQKGQWNTAPTPATPGTVATGGTVSNSLGYDVVVYASATTGITSAKVGTVSVPGSAISGQTATYVVPGGSTITIGYSGTLTWVWLVK
jgi:hypothetical protein